MKKKYFMTTDEHGHFFFNGVDITNEWHWHFAGLTHEQEHRCRKLFIPYILRRKPELRVSQTKGGKE